MQVKSQSGRTFDVPTAPQEAAIRTRIAALGKTKTVFRCQNKCVIINLRNV